MERKNTVSSSPPGDTRQTSIFFPNTLELISGEFADNLSYYRNYRQDDRIAGMFLGCALEMIDCTYYTHTKSSAAAKDRITSALVDSWSAGVNGTHLLEEILDPAQAEETIEQNNMLLESFRERYQAVIRGPRGRCWTESSRSAAENLDSCRAWTEGCEGEADPNLKDRCSLFYTSWRSTMLALEDSEELRGDPPRFAAEIRKRCRILSLLTVPDRLSEFVSSNYGQAPQGTDEVRSVRGAIVRILTMLIDECLAEISRQMHLPRERFLYLSRRPC